VNLALTKLGKLAKKRNLAAHNAPMAHVYANAQTGELEVRFEVRGANNPGMQVTPESLESWFRDAVALDHEFARLAGDSRKAIPTDGCYRPEAVIWGGRAGLNGAT
jgi:hypothetical protein